MRRVLRPLFVAGLVSFLLGVWFSLNRVEKGLLQKIQNSKSITLLTDDPELWEPLAELSDLDGPVSLRITSAARTDWEDILKSKSGPKVCDFVAIKSFYLSDLIQEQMVAPYSQEDLWWRSELHPDFQSPAFDPQKSHFLPLLWSVTQWRPSDLTQKSDWRWLVRTSSDEALLLAYDLKLTEAIEGDSEGLEWSVVAFRLWQSLKNQVLLAFGTSDTFVPIAPVKATQVSSPEFFDAAGSGTRVDRNALPTDKMDLWLLGLGICPGQDSRDSARRDFLKWLLRPEVQIQLAERTQMGSTLMSMAHFSGEKSASPMGLREFSLNRLRQRNLPWRLGAVWADVLTGKISSTDIERLNHGEDISNE